MNGNVYLVTGAAGFIGSHLCEKLIESGSKVIGVDNLITGSLNNLSNIQSSNSFRFIEHDIVAPLKIEEKLNGIFHLASPASPVDYMKYPIETLRTNAIGGDNILTLAQNKNCPVLIASTSEVYGDPEIHPQIESYWGHANPIGTRSCYDEAKRYLEALATSFHRKLGTKTRIVRIFNTYGSRMRMNDGRVVPNFLTQALTNKNITVYGTGSQTRSFCYIDDMVDGILRAFNTDYNLPINLGTPKEYTILEFAKKIIEFTGSESKIVFLELPQDDPKKRCPDISKARSILNWEPKISIDVGLNITCQYFKGILRNR